MSTFTNILGSILGLALILGGPWFFEKYLGITFSSRSSRKSRLISDQVNILHIENYTQEQIQSAIKTVESKLLAKTSDNILKELEKKYGTWDSQPKVTKKNGA